jgi:hypothetical protein
MTGPFEQNVAVRSTQESHFVEINNSAREPGILTAEPPRASLDDDGAGLRWRAPVDRMDAVPALDLDQGTRGDQPLNLHSAG